MKNSSVVRRMRRQNEEIDMVAELDRILCGQLLMPLFMPIANARERTLIGYEALIRGPSDSPLHSPANLFKWAQGTGRLLELELLCREQSMRRFKHLNLDGKLFLNVTPATLLEPDFRSGMTLNLLDRIDLDPERVVIEITEQFPIDDYALMKDATRHYHDLGFQVALDDLGAGYSGLRSWSELRPHYVKIDRHFIEGLDSAPVKQEFVRSILEVARSIECQVIAEGIERVEEHRALNRLGIDLQQGYYYSRPTDQPPRQLDDRLFRFARDGTATGPGAARHSLGGLLQPRPPIRLDLPLQQAVALFREQPALQSLAVVEQERPLGLLHRENCLQLYLGAFGRERDERRPVSNFMEPQPLILEERTALEQVSQRISESDAHSVRHDFIITDQGRYRGMGALMDLLKLVTDLQVKTARHANPLTQLPGSVPASEEISRHLAQSRPFVACQLNIDHFKAFNDLYGYERGDRVITLLADTLRTHLDASLDFLGHTGGDDFLVLFGSPDWKARCRRIQDAFSRQAQDLYDDQERKTGGILGHDRQGMPAFFPLATLSIGAAIPDLQRCRSHHDVAILANDAKRLAKRRPGNSLFINRRRGPDRHIEKTRHSSTTVRPHPLHRVEKHSQRT